LKVHSKLIMSKLGKPAALVLVLIVFTSLSIFNPTSLKAQTPLVLNNFSGTIDSYFLHGGMYAYTINVSMSVETEANGEWVINNNYQITWRISIINFSPEAIKQPSNLSLTFHDPTVKISGTLNTIINQTSVTIGQDGFLKVKFTPDKQVNQADVQTSLLEDEIYSSQEQFMNGHWDQNFDIWINIVEPLSTSPLPSPTVPEFSQLMILSLCICILLIVVLIRKKYLGQISKTTFN
jgi:hypothetical protein